jgi:glycosyltransferase involved in cell wall biosynthesis
MPKLSKALTLENLPPFPPDKAGWPWIQASQPCPELMPDGSQWPRISIVTPSYNQGEFIEETIRSVLLQGYPNLEYLIIDGGSTDNSIEIIKKYQNYLSYWVSETDQGPADAINKGWQRTNGEILAYLNSDDAYLPGALATIAEAFQQNPQTKAICGNELVVDKDGFVIRKSNIEKVDHLSLLQLNLVPQPAIFIKSDILKSLGGLNLEVQYIFDFELWLRITRTNPMSCIPTVLAITRWHNKTITLTQRPKIAIETVRIIEKEINDYSHTLTMPERKNIIFRSNCLALDLHLQGKEIINSFKYALKALFIYPFSLSVILFILHKYKDYFNKNSPIEELQLFSTNNEQQIHWSSVCYINKIKI